MTSSAKTDKDAKDRQEKHQSILYALLRDDDNKYCVDCDAKGPRWASWNLGIFLCIRCAGIHRNLGVHISKVKSVTLDTWTPEQIAMVQDMGNSRARAVYEANLPDNFRRPQTDSALEAFVRAKYEQKKYIAAEWVPPKPRLHVMETSSSAAVDKAKMQAGVATAVPSGAKQWPHVVEDVSKDKKVRPRSNANISAFPLKTSEPSTRSASNVPPPIKAELHQSKAEPVSRVEAKAPEIDLLGLDAPVPIHAGVSSEDLFSDFLSCSMPQSTNASSTHATAGLSQQQGTGSSLGAELTADTSLFDVGGADQKKSTKDAIMALYGPQAGSMYGGGSVLGGYGAVQQGYGPVPGANPYGGVPVYMMPPQGGVGMVGLQQQQQQQAIHLQHMMMGPGGMPVQMGIPGHNMGGGMPAGMVQQNAYNVPAMYNIQQVQNQMAQMSLLNGGGRQGVLPGGGYTLNSNNSSGGQHQQQLMGEGAGGLQGATSWGGGVTQHPVYPVSANIWQ